MEGLPRSDEDRRFLKEIEAEEGGAVILDGAAGPPEAGSGPPVTRWEGNPQGTSLRAVPGRTQPPRPVP